jgi:phosphotransferase system  glucose/maltose/N-acetylglucosamine-specific IIC component
MSIWFFIIGGIIFLIYLFLTFWNIIYSNEKQREENYPTIGKKDISEKNEVKIELTNEFKNGLEEEA